MHRIPSADEADLDALRAAGWIHGSRVVAESIVETIAAGADPSGTIRRIAELARKHPEVAARAVTDARLGLRMAALAAGSRALTATVVRSEDPVRILEGDPAGFDITATSDLAIAVREALATVAAADLAGEIDMPQAGRLVSDIADAALQVAFERSDSAAAGLAAIAMGKWGGRELNYASDIDIVFVHDGDEGPAITAAARIVEILGGRDGNGAAFRVDADLRPEGASGPLSRSLDSFRAYWDRWAETWEAQALLKARPVAGHSSLTGAFMDSAVDFVFPERLGADAVRAVRAMKSRAEGLLDDDVTELKRGVGGIRDAEFAVQLLQLVHGRADPSVRGGNTLQALERLAEGGYVLREDAADLARAYRWLRDTEHRLQLVDMRQTHTLPDDPAARERIARTLGYRDDPTGSALESFERDLSARRTETRSIHERLFHRPVLDALADSAAAAMGAEAAATRLAAFGFLDTEGTANAVSDLTAGLSRRSRLMRNMLPLIMEWLSLSPDPDLGLHQLRRLLEETDDAGTLVTTLRDDPMAAERLCLTLGTSRLVADLLDRLPPLIPLFGNDTALAAWPDPGDLKDEVVRRIEIHDDHPAAIHGFHAEHLLSVAVADLAGLIDSREVGRRLSDLADATVHGALVAASGTSHPPVGLVAMGKWGGRELNYASDLDAIVVADDPGAAEIIERAIALLGAGRAGFRALDLDLGLRPEGRKGALVRGFDGYRAYWERWAGTWELQAMLRARPAAGDLALGSALVEMAQPYIFTERPTLPADIRAMKARIEAERIPFGEDPDFHLKLGRGGISDVEWTVQLLQMMNGSTHPQVRGPGTLESLESLRAAGAVSGPDSEVLAEAYDFCVEVRNRIFLRTGREAGSLPEDPAEATRLARALGYMAHPRTSLREDYRRVTRRARRTVERLFYGLDGPGRSTGA